jgi:hypothetical protein
MVPAAHARESCEAGPEGKIGIETWYMPDCQHVQFRLFAYLLVRQPVPVTLPTHDQERQARGRGQFAVLWVECPHGCLPRICDRPSGLRFNPLPFTVRSCRWLTARPDCRR